jgi:hypothetical protein
VVRSRHLRSVRVRSFLSHLDIFHYLENPDNITAGTVASFFNTGSTEFIGISGSLCVYSNEVLGSILPLLSSLVLQGRIAVEAPRISVRNLYRDLYRDLYTEIRLQSNMVASFSIDPLLICVTPIFSSMSVYCSYRAPLIVSILFNKEHVNILQILLKSRNF